MKTNSNPNPTTAHRRRRVRRMAAALGIVVGVAVMGTAFASVRARVVNRPAVNHETKRPLPQEWVWKKKAVTYDDMIRR